LSLVSSALSVGAKPAVREGPYSGERDSDVQVHLMPRPNSHGLATNDDGVGLVDEV
jgi:hypothetical protein